MTRKRGKTKYSKPYLKASIRAILFVSLIAIYSLFGYMSTLYSTTSTISRTTTTNGYDVFDNRNDNNIHRRLESTNTTNSTAVAEEEVSRIDGCVVRDPKHDPVNWHVALYLIGDLYMFLAIAIVCDELFVPTLEEMSSERHLHLSMDVAGATLMAAGGSAPELFTNVFGTFVQHSEVGIGTVVGSAVFNVLFVIAMCALWSKEVLQLTWWPLFRDSLYYSVGLVVLGVFVGVVSPSEIELWEAIVLFVMYIVYVIIMYFNRDIYRQLTGKELKMPGETPIEDEVENTTNGTKINTTATANGGSSNNNNDLENGTEGDKAGGIKDTEEESSNDEKPGSHRNNDTAVKWPSTFRSGILKLLRENQHRDTIPNQAEPPTSPNSKLIETVGIGLVASIAGDVHHTFQQVDGDKNGEIDRQELQQLFNKLECDVPDDKLETMMEELDVNNDGKITEEDFVVWYLNSEKQINLRVQVVFDSFDVDKTGTINHDKIKKLLSTLEPNVTDEDIEQAMNAMYQEGSTDEITFEEFSNWYNNSMLYHKQVKRIEEQMEKDNTNNNNDAKNTNNNDTCNNDNDDEDDDDDDGALIDSLYPPSGDDATCFGYVKYVLVLPIVFALVVTVPDVRKPGWHKFCYLSFCLSIVWIAFFSYYMVDWAERIGHTIGIPSVIMGITLLAAGTSVPDLLTSVIVARMGEGDMALSSSIGSNIFDILVGLPLPWLVYSAWFKEAITVRAIFLFVFVWNTAVCDVYAFVRSFLFCLDGWLCLAWTISPQHAFLYKICCPVDYYFSKRVERELDFPEEWRLTNSIPLYDFYSIVSF